MMMMMMTWQVRAGYRSQQLPVFVRMLDKESTWGHLNGLRSIIPTALVSGILGYPFVLPDMIGGNGYEGKPKPERELFIRWMELTAFLPAMQFSFLPWRYDNQTIAIARKFAHLHETVIGDEIEAAARDAVRHGMPHAVIIITRAQQVLRQAAASIYSEFRGHNNVYKRPDGQWLLYRVPKKKDTKLMAITLSFRNRFSKFFH